MSRPFQLMISLCLLLSLFTMGAEPTRKEISWDKTEHDFDTLKQGQIVEAVFVCHNGEDTLQLENVQASCGCIVPDWKRTPINPQDSTVIKVRFDTKGKGGKHTKVITVYTNQGLYELIIKAYIARE
jgi:hypothetical protein